MKIPAGNKYKNVKTPLDGHTFDSKREAGEFALLKLRERAGEVSEIELQPTFPLVVNGVKIGRFTADFRFVDHIEKRRRVIDVKSPPTAKNTAFRLRKKLAEALYGIEIEVCL
jgi:hypothetical protein